MYPKARFLALLLPIVSLGLAGCNELALRKGPGPILDATSVQTAATNQRTIVYALAQDAGYDHPELGVDYYRVAEAGFNYVDDQCSAYFDTIFFLDRERGQLKSGLAAASATTAAILGVTSASTLSLSVVASAFGFASAATDILAGTYLYSLPPATTQGLVNKLQIAYRGAAATASADINTPTAAYHQVQSYLALCLPPTIETEVANQVNAATAVGAPVPGGSIAVKTGSILPERPTIPASRPAIPASRVQFVRSITSTRQRVLPPPVLRERNPEGFNKFEKDLDQVTMKEIQGALCSQQNGNLKSLRDDMLEFFQAGTPNDRIRADRIQTKGVIQSDVDELEETISGNKDCLLKLDGAKAVAHHFR